jgi:hypothetical protein
VSSRKEQKEALRRERLERERQAKEAARRKRMVGLGIGGALALVALVVVGVLLITGAGGDGGKTGDVLPGGGKVPAQQVSDLGEAVTAAGCRTSSERATSRRHTDSLDKRVRYRANPPTDGSHYAVPAEDGAYGKAPRDEELVHTLEHGRVIIWFKPSLPKDARANLKAFFDDDSYQMLLVPRENMPYEVAASAWNRDPAPNGTGRLLGCPKYGAKVFDALRAFREENRSNGPEPIP